MRRIKYYFRVVDVKKDIANTICNALPDLKFEIDKFNDGSNLVMLLKIEDGKDYSTLFNKINVQKDLRKGVYISLVTESDSDGLTVPNFVTAFLNNIDNATIDFSFTCV